MLPLFRAKGKGVSGVPTVGDDVMRNEIMSYCSNASRETLLEEIDKRNQSIYFLENKVEALERKVLVTGLTTEELQGIHGLILNQVALIKELQNTDDVLKVHSAVTPLAILVSLVSKPTD